MLVLKLRLEHGYNVNNLYFGHGQRAESILERLSFLKVISYGGACLPLAYAFAWCNSFDMRSGFFGYPTAVAFHICASYVKCNMNGQQAGRHPRGWRGVGRMGRKGLHVYVLA